MEPSLPLFQDIADHNPTLSIAEESVPQYTHHGDFTKDRQPKQGSDDSELSEDSKPQEGSDDVDFTGDANSEEGSDGTGTGDVGLNLNEVKPFKV